MKKDTVQYTSIGGQALIEGVMMRGKDKVAMAVRKPDGEIVLKVTPLAQKFGWITKIPFLRGIFVLLSAMIIGVQALSYSSQFFAEGVEED
ncbi:MAG: DUF1385 domain-containing protein, partial [Bacillota bacterium]|nr:DUF1385 domain-containing protein [Bacillota bacterium]